MAIKKITLNVVLLKENLNFEDPATFIKDYIEANKIEFESAGLNAILYKKLGNPIESKWIRLLKNKIVGDFESSFPSNQASGATLFIQVQNRIFAINFGTLGRFNIPKHLIERTFGIYTTHKFLNSNESSSIKSATSRVNETNPVNKQRQFGSEISNNQLYLSMENSEALNELSIVNPLSEEFNRMIGKYSSLHIQMSFEESELPCIRFLEPKLNSLLSIYNTVTRDDIKQLFKGIFPLNSIESGELNNILSHYLQETPDQFFLFEPEIDFDFSSVSSYDIITSDTNYSDTILSLSNYLNLNSNPSFEDLNNDMVQILDEEGKTLKEWTILECLYGEIEHNDRCYILSYGEWFEVSKNKYDRINSTIDEVLDNTFVISENVKTRTREAISAQADNTRINKENIFNTYLNEEIEGHLFDVQSKQITVSEDQFEVCDILKLNTFYHVKYNYGASALSHLFNQGYVSAKSYAYFTVDFINAVNAHIANDEEHLNETYNNSTVHYLILNNKSVDRLTFFSKMVFDEKIRALKSMSYDVKLSWVRDVY